MSKSIVKPLGKKAYGSIPHLTGSKIIGTDKLVEKGMQGMLTKKVKDKGDRVIVREKLDGSCVAVTKLDGKLLPLIRVGYMAQTSPFKMHHMFNTWVFENYARFDRLLKDGERICGEWLVQAHGIRYKLPHAPFVAFDLITDKGRVIDSVLEDRCNKESIILAKKVATEPILPEEALKLLGNGGHGAIEKPEGIVYRYETKDNQVTSLAKYVRPDFTPGIYLPEFGGTEPVWNEHL